MSPPNTTPAALTDLLLDGMDQVDVVLGDQRDGLALPPCKKDILRANADPKEP